MKVQARHLDKELNRAANENQTVGTQGHTIAAAIMVRYPLKDISSTYVVLPLEKSASAKKAGVNFTSVRHVQVDGKRCILNSIPGSSRETVRELSVRLRGANPITFGLLTCLPQFYRCKRDTALFTECLITCLN